MQSATLQLHLEGDRRGFDADHPIVGTVVINTQEAIPAYGLQITLDLKDQSQKVDRGRHGEPHYHRFKRKAWDKSVMVAAFEGNIIHAGEHSYPFTFEVPADLPQSLYYSEVGCEYYVKLRYTLRAQIVPVSTDLLNNEDGRSQLRDHKRVNISPVRPLVNDPQFDIPVSFEKTVGLIGQKKAYLTVNVMKNFYVAGELAYMRVEVDNSAISTACHLVVSHTTRVRLQQYWRTYYKDRFRNKETFFLCGPGEKRTLNIQFRVAARRGNPPSQNAVRNSEDYYHQSTLVPHSLHAQTFFVTNFFTFQMTHDDTVFSNADTQKFFFQLI